MNWRNVLNAAVHLLVRLCHKLIKLLVDYNVNCKTDPLFSLSLLKLAEVTLRGCILVNR